MRPDKVEVRKEMRARRKSVPPDVRARAASIVCAKVSAGVRSGVCAVYLASADEIDLSAAIRDLLLRGVTVVAPRWNGGTYELAKLKGLEEGDLRKGPMGILEPREADLVRPRDVTVWLVPGLAFTRDGGRIGYGGGWYDRLMAAADGAARRLGIAYGFQIVAALPSEPHDVRLTAVIDDSQA